MIGTLLSDERGVSPVTGGIKMVAIPVVLAAIIATLVLDLGQQTQSELKTSLTVADCGADLRMSER